MTAVCMGSTCWGLLRKRLAVWLLAQLRLRDYWWDQVGPAGLALHQGGTALYQTALHQGVGPVG